MAFYDSTNSHLYSVYFAPRGSVRMFELGAQIAQQHLSPFDHIIGILGESGAGKSMLIKGMFPGLELTNDDAGVNVRPLPLLSIDEENIFYTPHTYHVDVRFEMGFTQPGVLADAVMEAKRRDRRVVVEHYELLYPYMQEKADLLVGVGEEIIVTRPTIFGPTPDEIHKIVYESIRYRQMAHTAEDLTERYLTDQDMARAEHGDIKKGFLLIFPGEQPPNVNVDLIERAVKEDIAKDMPIDYVDASHVSIGGETRFCTGPRTHVKTTGMIENFRLIKPLIHDKEHNRWILAGRVCAPDGGGDSLASINNTEI